MEVVTWHVFLCCRFARLYVHDVIMSCVGPGVGWGLCSIRVRQCPYYDKAVTSPLNFPPFPSLYDRNSRTSITKIKWQQLAAFFRGTFLCCTRLRVPACSTQTWLRTRPTGTSSTSSCSTLSPAYLMQPRLPAARTPASPSLQVEES